MVDFPVEVFSWLRGFSCTGSRVSDVPAPRAGGSKKVPGAALQGFRLQTDKAWFAK